jgi:hypothetical protein
MFESFGFCVSSFARAGLPGDVGDAGRLPSYSGNGDPGRLPCWYRIAIRAWQKVRVGPLWALLLLEALCLNSQ